MYSESTEALSSSEPDRFRQVEKAARRFLVAKGKERAEAASGVKRKRDRHHKGEDHSSEDAVVVNGSTFVDTRRPDVRLRSLSTDVFLLDAPGLPSGLYIIRGALSRQEELELARTSLEEFSAMEHTNLTNLRNLRRRQAEEKGEDVEAALADVPDSTTLWRDSIARKDDFKSLQALRWASLGYHYDWTSRCYYEDIKSPFPAKLGELCSSLASRVGCALVPEAAIVNYYPVGTTMGGHLDDAELTMEHPIVSISMGRSAIFLMGGRTKNIVPVPILVRGGDVVIMSGESRHCYHGVPHILTAIEEEAVFGGQCNAEATSPLPDSKKSNDYAGTHSPLPEGDENKHVVEYLSVSRLNINVRQVIREGDAWEPKCGVGAMQMNATKPPEFKRV